MAVTAEPITDAPETPDDSTDADTPTNDTAAMAEALKKANAEAKKYRLEAKAHSDELAKAAALNMSENEKAIAAARAEGMSEGVRRSGALLVDARIEAAATGRNVDVEALLEGLDRSRFLDDDGMPKVAEIQKWVDRVAPPSQDGHAPAPRVPGGVRAPATPKETNAEVLGAFIKNALGN